MLKAIIVDDEKRIRDGMKRLIDWEEHGFSIIKLASDGMEALEICRLEKPCLVITDIKMPRMDGLTLASELKKIDPDISIIIFSGYNDFNYAKQAIKYGVRNYLLKPVDKDELYAELDTIRNDILSRLSHEEEVRQDNEKLENLFLIRLINGDLSPEEILKNPAGRKIGLESATNLCICVIDTSSHPDKIVKTPDADKSQIRLHIRNELKQLIGETKMKYFCEYSKGFYCILFTSMDTPLKTEQLVAESDKIIKEIKDRCNIDPIIAIGDIVTSAADLKASYHTAKSLLDIKRIVDSGESILYKPSSNSSTDIIGILMYINMHYAEELNLKKLSDIFFISPVYLGQLLKKETGEYFNDLLNKIRVDNSRKHLQDSIYSIQKISEIVGYKSMDHFYKSFKAIVGKNPADYRKSCLPEIK